MAQEDENDLYVTQLKEVFDACDKSEIGKLNKNELEVLCKKLQLEDQTDSLLNQLLKGDANERVTFEEFKEGFVAVLSEAVEGVSSEEDQEYDTDLGTTAEGTASPKFFRARKRYGRRTLPESSEGEGTMGTADFSEYSSRSSRYTRSSRGHTSSRVSSFDVEEEPGGDYDDVDGPQHKPAVIGEDDDPVKLQLQETFEGDGQVNHNIADLENALDPVSEEEHLKEIWRELGVGKTGYLTLPELATVCEHIGMDEMNEEELEHLFAKLDVDGDELVSFQEFLQGLFQHGGPMTPSPAHRVTPNRPRSTPRLTTPRMKAKLTPFDGGDGRTQSPCFAAGAGLFSSIDPENTGYATGEEIIELWQGFGIQQGAEILDYLQFDTQRKVSLTELSYALEQELHAMEEDNATYQAALATYEHEAKYLRKNVDHLMGESNKLRSDLVESNNRISFLVKESDERLAALEKTKERDLSALEGRCQEQLKSLQTDMEREREVLIQQAVSIQQKLELELDESKEEEARLQEKLSFCQRELDKMEEEMFDVMEQNNELEKQGSRLHRELAAMEDLKTKLEELESNRASILDEHQKFSTQKITQLERENKHLKDHADELTLEVEDLSQALASSRKHRKVVEVTERIEGSLDSEEGDTPHNEDLQQAQGSANDNDEDLTSSRSKRKLPQRPSSDAADEDASDPAEESEVKDMRDTHQQEVLQLQRGFSMERRDIEDAFKMEIAELEDQHIREKNEMVKQFNEEKEALETEFAEKLQASLVEREQNIMEVLAQEKHELVIKHQSELNMMEHNYAREKADLIKRMREEFESELNHKLACQKEEYTIELEQTVTRDSTTEDHKRQVAELQLQLKLQDEELQLNFKQHTQRLQEQFEEQKVGLEERHRMDILKYEHMCTQGADQLQGQLKEDFTQLVEEHRIAVVEEERVRSSGLLDKEKDAIIEEFTKQQEQLVRKFKKEKREMEQKHQAEVSKLQRSVSQEKEKVHKERKHVQSRLQKEKSAIEQQCEQSLKAERSELEQLRTSLERQQQKLEVERQTLHAQYEAGVQRERDQLERERGALRQLMEEEVSRELHVQMEDEFLEQMDRVKGAFTDEQAQLQRQIQMLQEELQEVNNSRDMEESFRQKLSSQSQTAENKYKKQLEELRASNHRLRGENEKLEKEMCEKVMKVEMPQPMNVTQVHTTATTRPKTEDSLDKLILEAITQQSRLLVDRTSDLENSIRSLQPCESPHIVMLKRDHDKLVEEKKALQKEIDQLHEALADALETNSKTKDHKYQLDKWESERAALQQQLEITTEKLAVINTSMSLRDSEHLRDIYEIRDKLAHTVEVTKYNNVTVKLRETEQKAKSLAAALEERTAQTNKLIQGLRNDHERTMNQLQVDKVSIETKLRVTQSLLDTQVKKLKQQLNQASKLENLVKELYVENSHLMKCLELAERRGVDAEKQVHGLEEKCQLQHRVLKRLSTSISLV